MFNQKILIAYIMNMLLTKTKLIIIFLILTFPTNSNIVAQDSTIFYSGKIAPNFELESVDGDIVEMNEFIDNGPILICFWSVICKPCVDQLDAYSQIYSEFDDEDFTLIAISIDNERSIAKVKPYVKLKNYSFPVLYDINGEVSRMYYAFSIPYSVLLDKHGSIVYSRLGYKNGDEIQAVVLIKKLLGILE